MVHQYLDCDSLGKKTHLRELKITIITAKSSAEITAVID